MIPVNPHQTRQTFHCPDVLDVLILFHVPAKSDPARGPALRGQDSVVAELCILCRGDGGISSSCQESIPDSSRA